ncbi:hypothetical protein DMP06_04515 [Slackia equolifaciens]|uniref:Uncharacterized protein n=1 Tax=Slackia equolifaciens TaxID=498718 RepID=A0A3N0B0J5_9ACTN|nr:hypothetical protein [Slackia equolifaciens]RNL40632.1 hypothetical protein DMP06_04515 [Slackia equolifaciens]
MADKQDNPVEFFRSKTHPVTIWKATLKGYRDGFQGRPVKLADGMLDSEYIRATLARYEQDLSANWSNCIPKVSSIEASVSLREQELGALRPRLEALRQERERTRGSFDPKARKAGEERLDDELVASRRRADLKRELAPTLRLIEETEGRVHQLEQELCGLKNRVREVESITTLYCNCLVNECDEVLSHYVRAALRAMKNPIDPPWRLPRVRLDGQRLYLAGRAGKALDNSEVVCPSRGVELRDAFGAGGTYGVGYASAPGWGTSASSDHPDASSESSEGKVA